MDPKVWAMIQEMQRHIEVLNREMGAVMVNVEWLRWWVQREIAAIGITFITVLVNTFLLIQNNKNGKKA